MTKYLLTSAALFIIFFVTWLGTNLQPVAPCDVYYHEYFTIDNRAYYADNWLMVCDSVK